MRRFQITVNGTAYDVTVEELDANETASAPAAKPVQAAAPKAAPKPAAKPASAPAGATQVTAPMPGTVLKMNVKEGMSVKAGQALCVLEAMKMENEIPAPADGTVASVSVSVGDTVASGDVLVSLN